MTERIAGRLFARLREWTGSEVIEVSLPSGSTVQDLRQVIERTWPQAAGLLANTAVAVNNEYADLDHPIRSGDEVALIPPVSGGT
jgi:molybdopterin converting factor subunit 1